MLPDIVPLRSGHRGNGTETFCKIIEVCGITSLLETRHKSIDCFKAALMLKF